jgi:hypothetical protein
VNDAAAEIERIVQKVLAELRATDAAANGGSELPAAPQAREDENPRCVIADRVVTLATLEGRLDGASIVVVPRGAVITPAARDALKLRNARLEFADASHGEAKKVIELIVGIADVPDDVGAATKTIQDHLAGMASVQAMQQTDLTMLAGRMAEWIQSRPSLGIVLTRRPAAAVCLANRHRGLRAVWANTPKALAEAMNTIAPNVMTYNPADHAAAAQRSMLREFVSAGVRACPKEFDV